jgi:ferrous iron transport protein B
VALYGAIILGVLAVAGTLMNRVMPGKSSGLLIDLPPLRMPRPMNVLRKTSTKVVMFLADAGPLFAIGALLLSVLEITGGLVAIQEWLVPLTVGWLQLPSEASTAFVMGFVRRDFGAAGLLEMHLTEIQTVIALVTVTLFVPCIATVTMLFKERGTREGAAVWIGCLTIAFAVGGVLSQVLI